MLSGSATTEMGPNLIWAPDVFGPQEIWAPGNLGPEKFGPQEVWSLKNIGTEKIGPRTKIITWLFHEGPKFLGAQKSQGTK